MKVLDISSKFQGNSLLARRWKYLSRRINRQTFPSEA